MIESSTHGLGLSLRKVIPWDLRQALQLLQDHSLQWLCPALGVLVTEAKGPEGNAKAEPATYFIGSGAFLPGLGGQV